MFWRALRHPHVPEERARAKAIWDSLPEELHTPDQGFGRWSTGCGATWGVMERCDFGCTACYLAKGANQTDAMPFEQVAEQIDALKAHMGAGARIQITAGEVTLLPCDDLIRIVKYARDCGLIPMVMTHGQRFLREPEYLERLVLEAGLDRFSFHVDTTQRGRDGGDPETEAELMSVRDAMADLIRRTRKKTGKTLYAAHTVTVTADNLPELPDIVRWCVRNADTVRLLGLQPLAQVGRTRVEGRPNEVWEKVCEGIGRPIHDRTWLFGHPDCNQFACLWVCGKDVVEVRRKGSKLDSWFMGTLMQASLQGWTMQGEPQRIAYARLAGHLLRDPRPLLRGIFFSTVRLLGNWRLLKRPRPFVINVHHFMDADMLDTPEGKARVEACVFKLPVDGEMVSMCAFNGGGTRAAKTNERVEKAGAAIN